MVTAAYLKVVARCYDVGQWKLVLLIYVNFFTIDLYKGVDLVGEILAV